MKKFLFILFFFTTCSLVAQNFEQQRDSLTMRIKEVAAIQDSAQKTIAAQQFLQLFEETLNQTNSVNFDFDSIPFVGKVVSPDKKVRIFTWCVPFGKSYQYYGILQYVVDKKNKIVVLSDKKNSLTKPETTTLTNGDWFGALYYQMVQNKVGKQIYYTLFGFDFYSETNNRKLLDVLYFSENNEPIFGAPIFNNGQWKACRILFEYNADSQFFFDYLPRKKMIVYQSLIVEGEENNFVPTEIFDGLIFKKGEWLLQKNVTLSPKDFRK